MPRKFYKIEVGLSGLDEVTTSFQQELFYGTEVTSIVEVIWLGIQHSVSERGFLMVHGSNGTVRFACTSNKNPSLDNLKLPLPFEEE